MPCLFLPSSLHLQLLLGVLVFVTNANAQDCTSDTCLIDVYYISPQNEAWFIDKTCPPNLYSGRNETTLPIGTDINELYYFFCDICYGVSAGLARCRCFVCYLEGAEVVCFLKGTCSNVRTTKASTVVVPSTLTPQTLDTIPTISTSSTKTSVIDTTTSDQLITTVSSQTTAVTDTTTSIGTQNETLLAASRSLIIVVSVPIIAIAVIACISVIFVIILLIVQVIQKLRKDIKPVLAREPAYIEIDTIANRASIPLYMEVEEASNTHGYYVPMSSFPTEEQGRFAEDNGEEIIQGFTLNNVRELTEEMYGIITNQENTESQTADPWYYNNIQIRRLNSSVNKSGKLAFQKVPSFTQRNSHRIESTGFETYAKTENPIEQVDHSYEYLDGTNKFKDPPETNIGLYNRMSSMQLREINPDTIRITGTLGTGEFGSVHQASWDSPLGEKEIAIKVLKDRKDDAGGEKIQTAFLQEAAILGQFSHPNILRLVGVVTLTVPNMIVTELMQGELKRFLVALQTQHNQELDYETIAPHFLSFSRQVASGMQHLAEKGCIHRDIAARNILLTDKCVCKIADFGMSRRLEAESDYYRVKGNTKLPVKWSAPEAVFFKRYTLKSDVWSYGMLLYEIWSVGRKPWPYEDNRSTVEKMARGENLSPPAGCSRAIYELMVSTWQPKADKRPDMKDIVTRLNETDESLLARAELEKGKHDEAIILGAEPAVADNLYKDLQNKYL